MTASTKLLVPWKKIKRELSTTKRISTTKYVIFNTLFFEVKEMNLKPEWCQYDHKTLRANHLESFSCQFHLAKISNQLFPPLANSTTTSHSYGVDGRSFKHRMTHNFLTQLTYLITSCWRLKKNFTSNKNNISDGL